MYTVRLVALFRGGLLKENVPTESWRPSSRNCFRFATSLEVSQGGSAAVTRCMRSVRSQEERQEDSEWKTPGIQQGVETHVIPGLLLFVPRVGHGVPLPQDLHVLPFLLRVFKRIPVLLALPLPPRKTPLLFVWGLRVHGPPHLSSIKRHLTWTP